MVTPGNDHAMTKDAEVISDQQIFSSPKRQKTDCESEWVCQGGMHLQIKDKNIIMKGEKPTDKHMNASQKLLKEQFNLIEELLYALTQLGFLTTYKFFILVVTTGLHW